MKKTLSILAAAGVAAMLIGPAGARAAEAGDIKVYKSPWCGCCKTWMTHLRNSGFTVTAEDHEDMAPIKARLGVPPTLQSCHTAVVNGYVIEGHVPADDIKRLLTEGPEAVGLAVPGMPAGSPGMEGGGAADAYNVILYDNKDQSIWARY